MPITQTLVHFITKLSHKDYGKPHDVVRRFWHRRKQGVEVADLDWDDLYHNWLTLHNQNITTNAREQVYFNEMNSRMGAALTSATARAPLQPRLGSTTTPPRLDITPEDRPSMH